MDSFELLKTLKTHYSIKEPYWWKGAGEFEVVVGSVLTQQSKWENVELSLQNLKKFDHLSLEKIASCEEGILQQMIKPSGFYRKKAKVLKVLCKNIINDFGDFENFAYEVNREWLLAQKGIGRESADSILNYGCKKEAMVVDSYTSRLLEHFGYEFESYDELQEWIVDGVDGRVDGLYGKHMPLAQIYARFHGKIVEFCKEHLRGKNISDEGRAILGT